MRPVNLSLMLLTTGTQPLLKFSLNSILQQISDTDRITVSINSSDKNLIENTRAIVGGIDTGRKVNILVTNNKVSVYEHYRFAIENSGYPHTVIIHDDEIYNSSLVEEIRRGFSDPEVGVVVGGMIKVDLLEETIRLSQPHSFSESRVQNGLEWIRQEQGLYPRFCFSALALNKVHLDLDIFSATSTAADCIAVTHQAIGGKIYQSEKVFATWLQLPSRNSKWYLIHPGLVSPWKEFLEYFEKVGDEMLISRAMDYKSKSVGTFLRMLFFVGIANRDPSQVSTCLMKIGEINPGLSKSLSWLGSPFAVAILSGPCRIARRIKSTIANFRAKNDPENIDPCEHLMIDETFWNSYVQAALKAASPHLS